MSEFGDPVVLGASGLEVQRMGIGADSGISAAAPEWASERGINYFYWIFTAWRPCGRWSPRRCTRPLANSAGDTVRKGAASFLSEAIYPNPYLSDVAKTQLIFPILYETAR